MWWWASTKGRSNLERFLRGITPRPPSFSLSPSCANDLNTLWNRPGKDDIEYFKFGDLWDGFNETSVYGFGSQIELNNGESVAQYYIPYLSAIQIYTNKPMTISRNNSEAIESESECWSDDSGSEKLSRSLSNDSSRNWDVVFEDFSFEHDQNGTGQRLGSLDFEYYDTLCPYFRVPLSTKINELAEKYPPLLTLRSVDVSPASWMAIAWYPIYHIPSLRSDRDLLTSFLTFHTLSSYFQDDVVQGEDDKDEEEQCFAEEEGGTNKRILLAPFGLTTYKMNGDLWAKQGSYDHERLLYLHSAADSWLKQLNVDHHDFNFFTTNSPSHHPS